MKDEQGRYVYLNETYQKNFGIRRGQQYGKTDFEIPIRPRSLLNSGKTTRPPWPRAIQWNSREAVQSPDGDHRDWMSWKFPFHDASGQVFVAGIGLDITERKRAEDEHKRAEEAMRRSETKFRTLYDSSSDAVFLFGENGFFDCNKATLAIFGFSSREEFWSLHPADLSPAAQPQRHGFA